MKSRLECLLCFKRYTAKQINEGLYSLDTFICLACYVKMQRAPAQVRCFGKPTIIHIDKTGQAKQRQQGYNPKAIECRKVCPDRRVCRRIQETGSL